MLQAFRLPQSVISRYLGGQETDRVRRVSCFCFYVTIAVGAVIGALLIRRPVLVLLGAVVLFRTQLQKHGYA